MCSCPLPSSNGKSCPSGSATRSPPAGSTNEVSSFSVSFEITAPETPLPLSLPSLCNSHACLGADSPTRLPSRYGRHKGHDVCAMAEHRSLPGDARTLVHFRFFRRRSRSPNLKPASTKSCARLHPSVSQIETMRLRPLCADSVAKVFCVLGLKFSAP
jgi:hypothetical protein